jgi:hypothetical protein
MELDDNSIYSLLLCYLKGTNYLIDEKLIIEKIKLIYNENNNYDPSLINELIKNNSIGFTYRCVECGRDLGSINPRQLCAKLYCDYNINK